MNLEEYSRYCLQKLERRKSRLSYAFVWYLLGLGSAIIIFGFLDKVWLYYIEGLIAVAAAVVLFVIEMCWRRITELKTFLSEYRKGDRTSTTSTTDPAKASSEETK